MRQSAKYPTNPRKDDGEQLSLCSLTTHGQVQSLTPTNRPYADSNRSPSHAGAFQP